MFGRVGVGLGAGAGFWLGYFWEEGEGGLDIVIRVTKMKRKVLTVL